jgi:hypothetical protein
MCCPLNTSFLTNIKVVFLPVNCTSQLQPLDLKIIYAFKYSYGKQFVRKTVAMMDCSLLTDASYMKVAVLSGIYLITEAWKLITLNYNQELFCEVLVMSTATMTMH